MEPEQVTDGMISKVMKELGRRGGSAKVPKGASTLKPEERAELGRKGAAARWSSMTDEERKAHGARLAAARAAKKAGKGKKEV